MKKHYASQAEHLESDALQHTGTLLMVILAIVMYAMSH